MSTFFLKKDVTRLLLVKYKKQFFRTCIYVIIYGTMFTESGPVTKQNSQYLKAACQPLAI